jgi:hypothetical protein
VLQKQKRKKVSSSHVRWKKLRLRFLFQLLMRGLVRAGVCVLRAQQLANET